MYNPAKGMAQSTAIVVITQCHQTVKFKRRLQEAASVACIKCNKPGSLPSSQPGASLVQPTKKLQAHPNREPRRCNQLLQGARATDSFGYHQPREPPLKPTNKLQQQQPSNASVAVPMQHVSRSLSRCQQCNHTKLPTLSIQPPVQPYPVSLIAKKRKRRTAPERPFIADC